MVAGRVLHSSDYQRMPWKNGGGTTTEIWKAVSPGGEMLWRLSIADVASDGPFSEFPGVDRWIMVIDGKGMELDIDRMGKRHLNHPHEPLFFPGDAKTDCRLIDGAIRDFNFMIARSFGKGMLQVSRLKPGAAALLGASTAAIHVLAGGIDIDANGIQHLATGDTWIAEQFGKVKATGEALLAVISIETVTGA